MNQNQKLTLTTLTILMFTASASIGQTNKIYTINQEKYTYKMQVTQAVSADTFVITEGRKTSSTMYSKKDKKIDINEAVVFNVNPVAHFQFDSSDLTPSEGGKILTILSKKKLKNTPLAVTGYTCSLGPDEHNQTLSLQRAKTVANLLRRHGFTVATVQGKGSQNPVTSDPRLFRLNRRVTVRVKNKK